MNINRASLLVLLLSTFAAFSAQGAEAKWNAVKCQLSCTKKSCQNFEKGKACLANCSPNRVKNCKVSYDAVKAKKEAEAKKNADAGKPAPVVKRPAATPNKAPIAPKPPVKAPPAAPALPDPVKAPPVAPALPDPVKQENLPETSIADVCQKGQVGRINIKGLGLVDLRKETGVLQLTQNKVVFKAKVHGFGSQEFEIRSDAGQLGKSEPFNPKDPDVQAEAKNFGNLPSVEALIDSKGGNKSRGQVFCTQHPRTLEKFIAQEKEKEAEEKKARKEEASSVQARCQGDSVNNAVAFGGEVKQGINGKYFFSTDARAKEGIDGQEFIVKEGGRNKSVKGYEFEDAVSTHPGGQDVDKNTRGDLKIGKESVTGYVDKRTKKVICLGLDADQLEEYELEAPQPTP